MNKTNSKVDSYIHKLKQWKKETKLLRAILLSCKLTEEVKWDKPCYSYDNHNIIVIQGFKEYCALLFMKGMLLKDTDDMLTRTGVNTRVGRQIRFTDVADITKKKAKIKKYINQAIEIEKAGLKIVRDTNEKLIIPKEFQEKMHEMPDLKDAFNALTPGRQRGYIFYFSAPKQSKSRESRIEKYINQILDGEGLNDNYTSKSK